MKCNKYNTKSGKEIRLWQGDCMELMDKDKEWDLAIVDPPYGIGFDGRKESICKDNNHNKKAYKQKDWDKKPNKEYFNNLFDVSENQIIFGGNYFTKYLPDSMGWVVWDKQQRIKGSDGELIFTSYDRALRIYEKNRGFLAFENPIHPTQKLIALYRWLLQNYAEEDTILDTHGGSMSLAIACYIEDYELDIIELDEDYYNDAVERFEQHISQQTLF